MALQFLLLLVAGVTIGCSDEPDRPDWGGMGGGGGAGSGVETGPCNEGDERECGYKVGEEGDDVTCYRGIQTCESGMWGTCGSGELMTLPRMREEGVRFRPSYEIETISTVAASACTPADLCDPYCREKSQTTATYIGGSSGAPPVLCDGVSDPTECAAGMKCTHNLCTTGAPLTNGCDDCVTTVCAVQNTCCTGIWDQSCVNLAYARCLGSPPPYGLCDFALFSETTLTTANRPASGAVGAWGDIIVGTDGMPTMIVTAGNVSVKSQNGADRMGMTGGIWAGNNVVFEDGGSGGAGPTGANYETTINAGGNVKALGASGSGTPVVGGGHVTMSGNNHVMGSQGWIRARGNITGSTTSSTSGGAYAAGTASGITGTMVSGATYTPPTIEIPQTITAPSWAPATCGGATVEVDGSNPVKVGGVSQAATYVLPAGNYGALSITNGGKLTLASGGGTWTFSSIKTSGTDTSGGLQLGRSTAYASTEVYRVHVCGEVDVGDNFRVINTTGTTSPTSIPLLGVADAKRFTLSIGGTTGKTEFLTKAKISGVIISPGRTVKFGNGAVVNGAIWASGMDVGTDMIISQMSAADCSGMGFVDGTAPITTCPWDNTAAAIPASTKQPCRTGADCQINQRCTNVDTGDADAVASPTFNPCNHDKCTTGRGLAKTCDPCVNLICPTAGAGCCDTANNMAWTAACVAEVQTKCDATCSSPVGTRTGVCVSNVGQSAEASCTGTNGFDLAVGYVCTAGTIPICNHGSTNFDASTHGAVRVDWYLTSKRLFATTASPATNQQVGYLTSNTSFTVPAGQCRDLVEGTNATRTGTAMAQTTSYTVMVDPHWSLAECGNATAGANYGRRLDNWSWHDGTASIASCSPSDDYVEYEYIADCSAFPGSSARWGSLRWSATLGTGQQVVFRGKVVKVPYNADGTVNTTGLAANVAAASYTALVTDTSTDMNTCTTASMCSRGLTSGLGLSATAPQGQALSLRVEKSYGLAATNVTWEVNYTCEYDE